MHCLFNQYVRYPKWESLNNDNKKMLVKLGIVAGSM